jgi:hypothetical protein
MIARLPTAAFVRQVNERAGTTKPTAPRLAWRVALPAFAAAAIVVLSALWFAHPAPQDDPAMRWRGQAPGVQVYLHRAQESSKLTEQPVIAGDRLRYEVALPTGESGYAAVFALEEGRATPILPPEPGAIALRVVGNSLLPGSVEITAGGSPVELVLIVRGQYFSTAQIIPELEAADARGALAQVKGVAHQLSVAP